MKNQSTNIIIGIVLLIIAALYSVLTLLTPVVLDDCFYAINGRNLSDIFTTQLDAYLHINGRFIAHSITQLFDGIIGRKAFSICNGLIIALIAFALERCSNKDNEWSVLNVALGAVIMWFLYPDQYVSMFMTAGSLNYVWATAIILVFLLLISSKDISSKLMPLVYIYSFIAGAWGEIYSVAIAPALVILLLLKKVNNKQQAICCIFFILGSLLMIAAPGNWVRFFNGHSGGGLNISTNMINIFVWSARLKLLHLWIFILMLAIWLKKKQATLFIQTYLFELLCLVFYTLFICVLGVPSLRAFYPLFTFSTLILLKQIATLNINRNWQIAVSSLLIIGIVIDFCFELPHFVNNKQVVENIIEQKRNNPDLEYALIKPMHKSRKAIQSDAIGFEKGSWQNKAFFTYYNLQPFDLVPQEVAEKVAYLTNNSNQCLTQQELFHYTDNYGIAQVDKTAHCIHISYDDGNIIVFSSKLGRILSVFHINLNKHTFKSQNDIWLGKYLLKPIQLQTDLCDNSANQYGYYTTPQGQTFVFIQKDIINSAYSHKPIRLQLEE